MSPEEKKIYDIQSPQTKRMMDMQAGRPLKDDAEYFARPLPNPEDYHCLKEDGSIDLNVRDISPEEYALHKGARLRRGAAFEEVRTAYLMRMKAEGKIHPSLYHMIETEHVMPPDVVRERAAKTWLGGFGLKAIKEKFSEIMGKIFKPTHAEIVAEEIRKMRDEK